MLALAALVLIVSLIATTPEQRREARAALRPWTIPIGIAAAALWAALIFWR